MAESFFVHELRCSSCDAVSGAATDTAPRTSLGERCGDVFRVGDAIPRAPHVLAGTYLWVRAAAPGEPNRILADWPCPSCGSQQWVEVREEGGAIANIEVVPPTRAAFARQNWASDEVLSLVPIGSSKHGPWSSILGALDGDEPLPTSTPMELAVGEHVFPVRITRAGPRLDLSRVDEGQDVAARLDAMLESGVDDPALAPLSTLDWPKDDAVFFASPVRAGPANHVDFSVMRELIDQAKAIDARDAQATVGAEPAAFVDDRRAMLAACVERSVFSMDRTDERLQLVEGSFGAALASLIRASHMLRGWGLLHGADPRTAPVCLDYARLELWPPGSDGRAWAERAVNALDDDGTGAQGSFVDHSSTGRVTIWWRRDGAAPALLAITATGS